MFQNSKVIAALYFIAFVVCLVCFIGGRGWGYLVAAVVWILFGVYCLISDKDDNLRR
ncbi:MAG: hypothetical protein IJG48_02655 [Mogibacterium sp.]|nr:hypothetical protein [Mogibacterium sp.]